MSTWLRMLAIAGITASACVSLSAGDEDRSVELSPSDQASSSRTNRARDAGHFQDASVRITPAPQDARPPARRPTLAAEPDAEVESDLDAGFPELAEPILRDCTETLRCNSDTRGTLEACIAASTSALAGATPEARQRFLDIVMRCNTQRGCDYVSCTMQP